MAPPGGYRLIRTDSSPSEISSSAIPDSSSSSMSFLTLRMSIAVAPLRALAGATQALVGRPQRELVADGAESRDRPDGDVGKIGVAAELLARLHVAQVDLDERHADREQRVAQRHAGMRQRAR